jgi:hypothetical protein
LLRTPYLLSCAGTLAKIVASSSVPPCSWTTSRPTILYAAYAKKGQPYLHGRDQNHGGKLGKLTTSQRTRAVIPDVLFVVRTHENGSGRPCGDDSIEEWNAGGAAGSGELAVGDATNQVFAAQ